MEYFNFRKHLNLLSEIIDMPGPGSYDLDFREELKTLDFQLSLRYQKNPFGSNNPRFPKKRKRREVLKIDKNAFVNTTIQSDAEKHRKAEMLYNYLKQKDENKTSHMFSSTTPRFLQKEEGMEKSLKTSPIFLPPK
jgi:hypothetical protein